jgi:hypothetical protein
VCKTLSQHEIATVQTTSIDETVGIVRLSTILALAAALVIRVWKWQLKSDSLMEKSILA